MTGRHRRRYAGRRPPSATRGTLRVAVHGAALALAAGLATHSSIVVAAPAAVGRPAPIPALKGSRRGGAQGGLAGRYALRSVNGQLLPVAILVEELHHNTRVTGGVLILNGDNTYICETRLESSYMGLMQPQSDTIRGSWDVIGGSFVTLFVRATHTDTVATSGTQIVWSHATSRNAGLNRYTYSR